MEYISQVKQSGEWSYIVRTIRFNEEEFQHFLLNWIKFLLKHWEIHISDYFEREIIENLRADRFEVCIGDRKYGMKNKKGFLKFLKNTYGELGEKILEVVKKELIKED
jgi:hypothetical protein